jgi:hypothetical protein
LSRLVTEQLVVEVVQVKFPGIEVTVYEVTAEPPLFMGLFHDTTARVFPLTAEILVGLAA